MPTGRGQGRSTFTQGSAERFREWLKEQLDNYGWSYGRLAKETGISKGAVVRWLQDEDRHTHRKPSYANVQVLADLFGTDLELLLEYAGIKDTDEVEAPMTKLQRETSAVVGSMPDAILAVVNPMMRAVAVEGRRDEVLDAIRSALGSPNGVAEPE